ncbi:energy transducer TonB [Marinifilum sp. JC120]|nr:energy transducer TonB [Marinifilum sp. JC120]
MTRTARDSSEFFLATLASVVIAGLIYIGMQQLNNVEQSTDFTVVEGAIRIAQPQKDSVVETLKHKRLKEPEPPKQLPKTFSSQNKAKALKPVMNINVPNFSADMHPGLGGGISIPATDLGGFGGIGFSMDEVDETPQVMRSIPPQYPYGAKRNHIEGGVVVRMLVDAKGAPTNLSIHSATPEGIFEEAALNAAKRWRFRPGKYKGKAVDTWVLLPFNFTLTQ